MHKEKGDIEILLLLCCLVGVLIFFCFSLGITSVLVRPPDLTELTEEQDALQREKARSEELLKDLQKRKDALERQIREAQGDLLKKRQVSKKELLEELQKLQEEYEKIRNDIEKKQEELGTFLASNKEAGAIEEEKKRLEALKKRFQELNQKIEEIKNKLAQMGVMTADTGEIEENKNVLEELEKKKRDLQEQINKERVKGIWKGTTEVKRPLHVECKKNALIVYPQCRAIPLSELKDGNPLPGMVSGHDGIIFLVRPDGFESFEKGYHSVENMNIKLCYEPIDSETSLGFLKEQQ